MLSYIEKDSDQLHGKFQAVETKVRELVNAQTSELTKKVSELTAEIEVLKNENQVLASDNMGMTIRLEEYEARMVEKDRLLKKSLDQNQILSKKLVSLTEFCKTSMETMNTSMTAKFTAVSHSLRKISANTSVLSQKGGECGSLLPFRHTKSDQSM